MKKVSILAQTKYLDDKVASLLEKILTSSDIMFVSIPMDINVSLTEMFQRETVSIRCMHCLKEFCKSKHIDMDNMDVYTFFNSYSMLELRKSRNIGTKTIGELHYIAKHYGIDWGKS